MQLDTWNAKFLSFKQELDPSDVHVADGHRTSRFVAGITVLNQHKVIPVVKPIKQLTEIDSIVVTFSHL